MNYWVPIYRFTWILIIGLCLIALVCVFVPKYAEYRNRQQKKREYMENIRLEEIELKRYQHYKEQFDNNRDFLEKLARGEGMAKTNETICKVPDNLPAITNLRALNNPITNEPSPR